MVIECCSEATDKAASSARKEMLSGARLKAAKSEAFRNMINSLQEIAGVIVCSYVLMGDSEEEMCIVRYQVITEASVKTAVFWVV
jgi:hypothetical protein